MYSGTLHVSHITSSSTSVNDARGGAARDRAARPARARSRQSRREQARRVMRTPSPSRTARRRGTPRRPRRARSRRRGPRRSSTNVSGSFERAVLRGELQLVVAQRGVGHVRSSRSNSRDVVGVVLVRDAEHRAAAGAAAGAAGRARGSAPRARHGSHHEAQKFRTTTLPSQVRQRALRRRRPAAGAPRPRPGAAGRCPA